MEITGALIVYFGIGLVLAVALVLLSNHLDPTVGAEDTPLLVGLPTLVAWPVVLLFFLGIVVVWAAHKVARGT
jgi:hypothetical protein